MMESPSPRASRVRAFFTVLCIQWISLQAEDFLNFFPCGKDTPALCAGPYSFHGHPFVNSKKGFNDGCFVRTARWILTLHKF